MNNPNIPDNLKLYDTIILNGIVAMCKTGDENGETIGVKTVNQVKRLDGTVIEAVVSEFPFTKAMEQKLDWRYSYASIQMLTGNTPIDMDHIDETKIVSMMGEVDHEYYHRYSDLTGYLWTAEGFKCGGHDLHQILHSHMGEYIYMEIELYRR